MAACGFSSSLFPFWADWWLYKLIFRNTPPGARRNGVTGWGGFRETFSRNLQRGRGIFCSPQISANIRQTYHKISLSNPKWPQYPPLPFLHVYPNSGATISAWCCLSALSWRHNVCGYPSLRAVAGKGNQCFHSTPILKALKHFPRVCVFFRKWKYMSQLFFFFFFTITIK